MCSVCAAHPKNWPNSSLIFKNSLSRFSITKTNFTITCLCMLVLIYFDFTCPTISIANQVSSSYKVKLMLLLSHRIDWLHAQKSVLIAKSGQPLDWPASHIQRLQSVQNDAAKLIFNLRRCDHIINALISLHWLRVPERIIFKVATLTYRALHGSAPPYLASSFTCVTDMPHRRRLRSASTEQLDVPTCRRSTVVDRAFPVAEARVWNSLPSDVTSASSLPVFKNRLKTYTCSAAATKLFDSELHFFFLVIISPSEQCSLQ